MVAASPRNSFTLPRRQLLKALSLAALEALFFGREIIYMNCILIDKASNDRPRHDFVRANKLLAISLDFIATLGLVIYYSCVTQRIAAHSSMYARGFLHFARRLGRSCRLHFSLVYKSARNLRSDFHFQSNCCVHGHCRIQSEIVNCAKTSHVRAGRSEQRELY